MRNWKEQDDRQQLLQVLRHLFQCTKCWDCHSTDLEKLLDRTVKHYKRAYEQELFELLSDLAVTPNQTHLYRYHTSLHALSSVATYRLVLKPTLSPLQWILGTASVSDLYV
jgi:hypothetical protein